MNMIKGKYSGKIAIAIGTIFLFSLMFIVRSTYLQHVMIILLQTITLAVSYRFITLSGQWTFAHCTMMGVGAYTSAILSTKLGYPVWISWPTGIVITCLIACLLGLLIVRTRHVYFFFATWAFAYVVEITWKKLWFPFGGHDGIRNIPRPGPWFSSEAHFYYLILGITLMSLVVLYKLEKSRFGRTLVCINENEDLARSIGFNAFRFRMLVFVIGSAFAGLMGGFYTHYAGFIGPDDFGWMLNWFIVIYIVSGGSRTILGPIIGTLIFVPVMQILAVYRNYITIAMGLYTIFIIMVATDGIEGLIWRLRHPGEVGVSRALR
jgi:branched-chain amino acid transport system permease protein